MNATSIAAAHTRLIPADRNKPVSMTKNKDGSLSFRLKNGEEFTTNDKDLQAFVVWTMLNPDCTK